MPRPGTTREAVLDMMMEGLLIALLVFTPLAFGAVQTWALSLMQAGLIILFGLWVCRLIWSRSPARPARTRSKGGVSLTLLGYRFVRTGLGIPILMFLCLVAGQLVPLPPRVVQAVSPETARTFARSLPGWEDGTTVDFARLERWLSPGATEVVVPPLLAASGKLPVSDSVSFGRTRPLSIYPFATMVRLLTLLTLLMVFLVVANCLRSRAQHERILWVVTLAGFGMSVLAILQFLAWNGKIYWFYPVTEESSPFGPFLNHNHFAAYLEMAVPVTLGLFLLNLRRGRQAVAPLVLGGFSAVVMLAALALAGSRGAILSLAAATAVYGVVMIVRRQAGPLEWTVAACAIAGALLFSAWIGAGRLGEMVARLQSVAAYEQEPSLAARLVAWTHTLKIVGDFPVFGSGLGTFTEAWLRYYPAGTANIWKEAHNDYLQLTAETGLPGLILLAAGLWVFLGKYLFRAQGIARGQVPADLSIHHGIGIGLLSILFHESVDFSLQVGAIALLFVVLSAIMIGDAVRRSEVAT